LRQQIFDLGSFGIVDIIYDVGKSFLRVDIILGAGCKKTVEHGNIFGCFV
jgi:hypothetical protein